jgi:hypothetical protein
MDYAAFNAILEGDEEPLDPIGSNAVIAFGRMVDKTATVEDLHNYRAWIALCRLDGVSEEDLHTSLAVADALASDLGVQ